MISEVLFATAGKLCVNAENYNWKNINKSTVFPIAKLWKLCYNTACVHDQGAFPLGCRQAVRHQTLTLAFVGSNPAIPANDPLAQSVEQLPFKQWVRSSNLRRVTRKAIPNGMAFLYIKTLAWQSPEFSEYFTDKNQMFSRFRWGSPHQPAGWFAMTLLFEAFLTR